MKDPYINENGVLKNKLGITDERELEKAEKDITFIQLIKMNELENKVLDENILKKIHTYLFKDIYEWAGEYRTVPIYKEEIVIPGLSLEYAQPKDIKPRLAEEFNKLNSIDWNNKKIDELSLQLTKSLADIWRVHPFRDGNTRTVLTFASIFAKIKGFDLDMSCILDNLSRKIDENGKITQFSVRDKFVLAALDEKDYPEYEHLQIILKKSIHSGIESHINNLKKIIQPDEER